MNQTALFAESGAPTAEAMRHARSAADDGMSRALDHAENDCPCWTQTALNYVRAYAEVNEFFPWYFITMSAENDKTFPAPENEKSWGSITTMAVRRGIIADSGKSTPHPRRHGVKATVWRSLVYKGAA